jgi:hypothetical protein
MAAGRFVVGAPGERGGYGGVNPPSWDNDVPEAGAAYAFVGNGSSWTETYLKASNPGVADEFGQSVAISSDSFVVGAPYEDGSGTGINPAAFEGAADAGAAYVVVPFMLPDAFVDATIITVLPYLSMQDSSAATTGAEDPIPACGNGSRARSVWYLYTPTVDGPLSVKTDGSSYHTILSVYTGSPGSFTPLACQAWSNGFQPSLAIQGTAGQRLAILVTSSGTEGGTVWLRLARLPGPFGKTAPANGATAQRPVPTLTWTASTNATNYEYCIDKTNDGQCHSWNPTGTPSSLTLHNLLPGVTYYWQVRALNGAGATYADGGTAAIWSFTTREPARLQVDLNGDGSGDVFSYLPETGAWFRRISQVGQSFLLQSQGNWAPGWSVVPARFNADSLTDFFLFNTTTGGWAKVLNDGIGFTTHSSGSWWSGWERLVMDLDSDGVSDVFLYDPLGGTWFKCVSTADGFSYAQGGWTPGWELYPVWFDNDLIADLFLIDRTTGRWFWALGQEGAEFTYPATQTWSPGWQLYPGDFNGDGLTDILLHDPPTGTYFVATNTGTGFSYVQGQWTLGWQPYVGDFNADNKQDLFLHDAATGVGLKILSDGTGKFTSTSGQKWTLGWSLFLLDIAGDNRADIVLYNPETGAWYQARNLLDAFFIYHNGTWAPGLTLITRAPIR